MRQGRPRDLEKRRYWRGQIEAWEGSGLSQAEYCRRQGLRPSVMRTWKHRLGAAAPPEDGEVQFVALPWVAVDDPPEGAAARQPSWLTLVVEDRFRVEIGDGFAPATLARVLQTLQALG